MQLKINIIAINAGRNIQKLWMEANKENEYWNMSAFNEGHYVNNCQFVKEDVMWKSQ